MSKACQTCENITKEVGAPMRNCDVCPIGQKKRIARLTQQVIVDTRYEPPYGVHCLDHENETEIFVGSQTKLRIHKLYGPANVPPIFISYDPNSETGWSIKVQTLEEYYADMEKESELADEKY